MFAYRVILKVNTQFYTKFLYVACTQSFELGGDAAPITGYRAKIYVTSSCGHNIQWFLE